MAYEKVRSLFDAIRTGEHDLARAIETNFRADEGSPTTKHFIRFPELLKVWKKAILEDSALDEVQSARSDAPSIGRCREADALLTSGAPRAVAELAVAAFFFFSIIMADDG